MVVCIIGNVTIVTMHCIRYVAVGETDDLELFYYFVESQSNPVKDPLVYQSTLIYFQFSYLKERNFEILCLPFKTFKETMKMKNGRKMYNLYYLFP